MYEVEEYHGWSNRITWLTALYYLDVLENLLDGGTINTVDDVITYITEDLNQWAEDTFVAAAETDLIEIYQNLMEINFDEIFDALKEEE